MSNIVSLRGACPAEAQREPNPEVVAFCEHLAAKARSGGIRGIAVTYVDAADGVTTDWSSGQADSHDLVAGTSMLNYRVNRALFEDDI